MERECYVVLDLLPSYAEGLTGEKTGEWIKQHIENCSKCKERYGDFIRDREREAERELAVGKGFRRSLRRYHYQMLGLFLGIILTVCLLFLYIMLSSYQTKQNQTAVVHTENIEDYGQLENYQGYSELLLFPEKEAMKGDIIRYEYDCEGVGDMVWQNCQIYLECKYSPEAFVQEKQRLLSIIHPETGLHVCYDDGEEFHYPAVYAMLYDSNGCYEYALFQEEENKIVYVYLQGIERDEICFLSFLLPSAYGQTGMMFETEKEPFSIYPKEEIY